MVLSNRVYSTNDRKKQVYVPMSQKEFLEQHLIKKRNAEKDRFEYWSGTEKYYENVGHQSSRFQHLNSIKQTDSTYQTEEIRKQGLLKRREKLKNLIQKDEEMWEKELEGVKVEENITDLRQIREQFRLQREEEQRKEAELKMLQHWRINNPTIRQIESSRNQTLVRQYWDKQLEEKKKEEERRKLEEDELARSRLEEEAQRKIQLEQDDENRRKRIEDWKRELNHQLEELRHKEDKEKELERARQEQEEHQRRIEECEEERRRRDEKRKNKELETYQKRQHRTRLKRMAEEVEKEIQEDRRNLQTMVELVQAQNRLENEQKEKCLKEVRWMQKVLKEQADEENRRKKELDFVFAEEAERMWNKQQEIWDREEKARRRLMDEVAASWREQNLHRLEAARKEEQEAILQRQELKREVEELHRSIEEEERRSKIMKERFREGLKEGVRHVETRRREVMFQEEKEGLEEREEELREENRLARYIKNMEIQEQDLTSYIQDFRRKKVKWFY